MPEHTPPVRLFTEAQILPILAELAEAEQAGTAEPATLHLGPFSAYTLIGLLQLTWRHPGLSGRQRQLIRRITTPLETLFDGVLRDSITAGWDTSQDYPAPPIDKSKCPVCKAGVVNEQTGICDVCSQDYTSPAPGSTEGPGTL